MNSDFLVEIGTEELPPKALQSLSQTFKQGIEQGLAEQNLTFKSLKAFATPRRLAVLVSALATNQPDKVITKQGPPVKAAFDAEGKPTKAAAGFARNNGVSVDQLQRLDTDKGERLLFRSEIKGMTAAQLLPAIVAGSLEKLPVPKRMRWGSSKTEFVRPIHWLVMMLDSDVIPCNILGLRADNKTRGHRFMHNQNIEINSPDDYEPLLEKTGKVIADFDKRLNLIKMQVQQAAQDLNGIAQIDEDLLAEVTGLVEWPVALTGKFEERFLEVPSEALISSMKSHQKYFHVYSQHSDLLPYFITIANIDSQQPELVVSGNERVIRPRLADAAFFYSTDKNTSLDQQRQKLKPIIFQHKIGSVFDKTERLVKLSVLIAKQIDGNSQYAKRAATLSKADLVSEMVREFEDLQGTMGYHYAKHEGEAEEVAIALREQYLPKFAGDQLPNSLTGCALAIADRLDTLIGIFGIGEPPTGNKDPFALRRAAIGILNIIIKKQLNLDLRNLLQAAKDNYSSLPAAEGLVDKTLAYLIDRLKGIYTSEAMAVEIFMSVNARGITKPVDFDKRMKAVFAFTQLPAANSLAAANKRVANILAKEKAPATSEIKIELFEEDAEKQLAKQVVELQTELRPLLQDANYEQVLTSLASLKETVDLFFDNVMVAVDNIELKMNRLAILRNLQSLFLEVADISLLVVSK